MDNVVYGIGIVNYGNNGVISEGAKGSFEYIRKDVRDIKRRYITLGFHLDECERCGYYKEFGFSTFHEFIEANFSISKASLSNILSVFYRFSAMDKNRPGVRTIWIDEKYSDYTYSQLCEMVSLKDSELKCVTPKMSVREIKDYKKSIKRKNVQTSEQMKNVGKKVLTKEEKCDTSPLSDPTRPFDERYQLTTGKDLFVEILDCLKNNIKNVDKVQAIIKLLNGSGL